VDVSNPERIKALTFPADDAVFAERVREVLGRAPEGEDELALYVTQRLSSLHPAIRTSFRSDLAGFGQRAMYVFRDGGVVRTPRDGSWLDDPMTARVVTDHTGRYVDANEAAAKLFGVPRDEIIGAPAGSFTRPDLRIEDTDALWHALERNGRLDSLAILRCPDGTEQSVEFVTLRDGDGTGRHVTHLRKVE
jgi:PAS domain S-box-containing protein